MTQIDLEWLERELTEQRRANGLLQTEFNRLREQLWNAPAAPKVEPLAPWLNEIGPDDVGDITVFQSEIIDALETISAQIHEGNKLIADIAEKETK